MTPIYRYMTPRDVGGCLELVRREPGLEDCHLASLQRMWCMLLESSSALACVVVDRDGTPPSIVGFAMSVFVTDAFAEEARTTLLPYLIPRLLERWLGPRSPFLSLPEIRAANKGDGLNFLGLHTNWSSRNLPPEGHARVRDGLLASLREVHAGYKLKTFLKEIYGAEERVRYERYFGAGSLRPDYGRTLRTEAGKAISEAERPYLVGSTRAEALSEENQVKPIRELFLYRPPVCGFTARQQELLQRALLGSSGEAVAEGLGITPDSMDDLWQGAFERVAKNAPPLWNELHAGLDGESADNGQRMRDGREKRSRLLEYVRRHPEEVRPATYLGDTGSHLLQWQAGG